MNINKIAILDNKPRPFIQKHHVKDMKQVIPEVEVIYADDARELMAKTTDADVLLTFPYVEGIADFCKKTPSLKWIHGVVSGVDGFMKPEIQDRNIRITSTKGIHGMPIADHVLAYIFSFLRAFPHFNEYKRSKVWGDAAYSLCDETYNKTVGIIGLGNIGLYLAMKCKLLDFRVVGLKRNPIESEWVDKCYINAQIEEFLGECDFVIAIVPLTSETQNMIGERELRMMKNSAFLINIARGGVIDENALIRALQNKVIAGAGLDVFVQEPLSQSSPLWDMPNVILTPHSAAQSPFYNDRANEVFLENLRRYYRDQKLLFEVDKNRGW
ncbi:D-2-hydroxyacid dehydrogenase [Desulfitobacterium chlororespirans]|uniref:Phosphoglycerate dehydrogenase n=1 Tax=Desulfitobacterium chlororespirans DSM 11544 TaxID=1121395 RepID=A0A1M7UJR5_9FIRM|nr:D-2-hydroxyacid dehydrogenase [Desulfitobacterium chlororespirans]SHN83271.1 Phosphoglycerate dehydrogenase [Desulfitobacterium chlororespirans DSM 11544]